MKSNLSTELPEIKIYNVALWKKRVIYSSIALFVFLVLLPIFAIENQPVISLLTLTHAIFCWKLSYVISHNTVKSYATGVAALVFSWVALGIGTWLITIYLFLKSNNILKK